MILSFIESWPLSKELVLQQTLVSKASYPDPYTRNSAILGLDWLSQKEIISCMNFV